MVSDGILAQPPLFQKGHRVPHRWLITRTDVSVLAYSVFNVQQRVLIYPSTIYGTIFAAVIKCHKTRQRLLYIADVVLLRSFYFGGFIRVFPSEISR